MSSEPVLYIAGLPFKASSLWARLTASDSLQVLDWFGYESQLINELKLLPLFQISHLAKKCRTIFVLMCGELVIYDIDLWRFSLQEGCD